MTRYITLDDDTASKLFLALEQSTGEVRPHADPVEGPAAIIVTPAQPVQPQSVPNDVLVQYVFGSQQDIAHEFTQLLDFYRQHPDLQTPKAIVDAYRDAKKTVPQADDVMWNAGTGFPIESINYPDDAYFIFRMGQKLGRPLWYQVLAGRQSQIGALIQRVGAGAEIVAAQAFNTDTYNGPLRSYVR